MVEEVDGELGALALSSAALLERALVDHLALLVPESEVDRLAVLEDELLVKLGEIEPVLALAGLDVDLGEELAHELDHLGQDELVRVVIRRVLEARLEQKRVSREARRRLGEVAVQLELATLGLALRFLTSGGLGEHPNCAGGREKTHVDELGKGRVRSLLLLKLVLAVQLDRKSVV